MSRGGGRGARGRGRAVGRRASCGWTARGVWWRGGGGGGGPARGRAPAAAREEEGARWGGGRLVGGRLGVCGGGGGRGGPCARELASADGRGDLRARELGPAAPEVGVDRPESRLADRDEAGAPALALDA